MKRVTVFFLILLMIFGFALAESEQERSLRSADLSGMEDYAGEYATDFDVREIAENALEGKLPSPKQMLNSLRNKLRSALGEGLRLCGELIAPVLLLGVLKSVSRENSAADYICLIGLASGIIEIGLRAISAAEECISLANRFTETAAPVFAAFLTAIGRADGAALITPAAAMTGSLSVRVFQRLGLPLCRFALCACAAGAFSRTLRTERAADLLAKLATWGTGLCVTVFTAMTAIRSDISVSLDGIAVRTAKFAMDSAAPVIGSGVSDAWETYVSGVMIAKSAVGATGILLLMAACAVPMLRILTVFTLESAAAALADIFGVRECARILSKAGNVCKMALMMCTGCIAVSTVLFGAVIKAGAG